jgi:cytochrome c biogenesis protein CcdA/thiol-disulfide isomerase/thioredoxin
MFLLFLFAFISGLVTIFAPCIWPILPLILSSSLGGHKKPLGITLGIMISFGIMTLFLSYIVKIIPFDTNLLRWFAVIVIGILGLTLLIPKISQILEGAVSRFVGKLNITQSNQNAGFWSGFGTGLVLGIVWTPCAGPILATIATLAATQKLNLSTIFVTTSYVLGVGIPLYVFVSFGNRIFAKSRLFSRYTGIVQQIFGLVMILTAILIATGYDTFLESRLLNIVPSYSNALNGLESNNIVKTELNNLKSSNITLPSLNDLSLFNVNFQAPDFTGVTTWLNTNKSISINDLKGKVVLVDFWTYTCINCIRTLPHVTDWYEKYKDIGFIVIGVHTPEFQFEHDTVNVSNALKTYSIHYPVAQDNNYLTWNNYNNEYWPAEYLIDAKGFVRRTHFGEGEYDQTEMAIQELLKQAGQKISAKLDNVSDQTPNTSLSPETYLGSKRMQYYYPSGTMASGINNFSLTENLPLNSFSYGGNWNITDETAIALENAGLNYNFTAQKVYILRPPKDSKNANSKIKVYLDGKIIEKQVSGADVFNGEIIVNQDRLYNVVDLHGKSESHILKLEFKNKGIEAYTFTFG